MYEDLLMREESLRGEMKQATPLRQDVILQQLREISAVLAETVKAVTGFGKTGDPVIDAWEEAIERGEMPDFDSDGGAR